MNKDCQNRRIVDADAIVKLKKKAIKDFKNLLLNSCIDGYRSIVAASPAKNIYLRGWINRVEGLRRA